MFFCTINGMHADDDVWIFINKLIQIEVHVTLFWWAENSRLFGLCKWTSSTVSKMCGMYILLKQA